MKKTIRKHAWGLKRSILGNFRRNTSNILEVFWREIQTIQILVMKSLFFEHFYDLTGPTYAEKQKDCIHFLTTNA